MALTKLTVTQNFPNNAQHQATADEDVSFRVPDGTPVYIITTMTDVKPSEADMKYGIQVGSKDQDDETPKERSMTLNNGEYVWIAHGVGGTSIEIGMHS